MNPVHHGFVSDFSEWKHSSYNMLCSTGETFLAREKVISWFGNVEEFKKAHQIFERGNLPEYFSQD